MKKKNTEFRHKALFDNMMDGVAVYEVKNNGEDVIFLDMNKAGQKIFDVKRADIVGKNVVDVFPGVKDLGLLDVFKRVWRTGEPEYHPVGYYKAGGVSQWVENTVYKLPTGEIVAIYKDNTALKQQQQELKRAYDEQEECITARTRDLNKANEALKSEIEIRKNREKEISNSEMRFRSLIESSEDGILAYDKNIHYTLWNPKMERLTGIMASDLIGKSPLEVFPFLEEVGMREVLTRTVKGEATRRTEMPFNVQETGKSGWFETSHFPLYNADGEVIGGMGIVRDITDRKNADEALKASERRYRHLVEGSPNIVYIFSSKKGATYCSKRVEEVLGYSTSYLLEHPLLWHDSIHPEDIAEVDIAIEEFHKGRDFKIEYRIKDAKGKWHWFLDRFIGKEIQGDEIIIEGLATDITERKNIEIALRESKERFESAFKYAAIGMALTHLDGRWFYVNQPFCDITGYSISEMESMKFQDITHPDDLGKDLSYVQQLLAGEINSFQMEKRYIQKSGHTVWILLSASLVRDENRSPLYFIAQLQDITESKKAEEELIIAKENAEKATTTKDKFVSLVAHDLRSPAGSISRLLELLISNIGEQLPDDQRKFLEFASLSAKKMNHLIDDILNMSRLRSGILKPKLRFMNPCILALKIMESFEHPAGQKGIQLVNKITEAGQIFTDETLFEQVIGNLLSNAIKFSKDGDTITIFIPEGEPNTIAVSDTGTGIHPNILKDLFDYDKKTSIPGTDGEIGTGFGLPLSLELMKTLGGDLKAESDYGKGSVFFAKLPGIRPRILIVDDEEAFRLEQTLHLEKLRVEITEAVNGKDALAKIDKVKPHLIITDIGMPVMDGLELLAKIKSNPETANIPVIVVTVFEGMEIREKAFRSGADDFVPKPFDPEELIPRVKRFLW